MSQLSTWLWYDEKSPEFIQVCTIIPNRESYMAIFGSNDLGRMHIIPEEVYGLDAKGNELNIYFDNIAQTTVNMSYGLVGEYREFPMTISYVIPGAFVEEGTHHTGVGVIDATRYRALITDRSFLLTDQEDQYPDQVVNLSYREDWKSLTTVYNEGRQLDSFNDGSSYVVEDVRGAFAIAIGDIELRTYDFKGTDYIYGNFRHNGDFDTIIPKEHIENTRIAFERFVEVFGPAPFDERLVFIDGPQADTIGLPVHPWYGFGNEGHVSHFVDMHGLARLWFGGSSLNFDGEAYWIGGGGVSDTIYALNHQTGYRYDIYRHVGEDYDGIPAFMDKYVKHVKDNDYYNRPLSEHGFLNPDEIPDFYTEFGDKYRSGRVLVGTIILDMLVHSSSGGEVVDLLEVIGELYKTVDQVTTSNLFGAVKKFSDYDFSDYIEAYVYGAENYNIDTYVSNDQKICYTAFSDYSDQILEIEVLAEDQFIIRGKALQDTFVGMSSHQGFERIAINGREIKEWYTPWSSEFIISLAVEAGDYEIRVSVNPEVHVPYDYRPE